MKDEDEKILDFDRQEPADEDKEIKDAVDNLVHAFEGKASREAQKIIERYPTNELRKRIISESMQAFENASKAVASALAVLTILGLDSRLPDLLADHAAFQVKVLREYGMEGISDSDDVAEAKILEVEQEYVDDFVKRHSGDHKGCVLDEYRKRMAEDWPDQVDDLGGDDHGVN